MKGLPCFSPPLSFSPLSLTLPVIPGPPDAELCEPRQREQPRNPCQGAQL